MRTMLFRIASVSIALSAAIACAASGDEGTQAQQPPEDGGTTSIAEADAADAAQPDVVAPSDVNVAPSTCSDAGWCVTPLPDPDLTISDIWPLDDGHAFALASTSVLEWDDSVGHWVYIDDGSARNLPNATLANVWAPSKDEVYFTVAARSPKLSASVSSAHLFHGTRSSQGWSWEHVDFGCDVNSSMPQVWGTSHDDVYVWACGSIRHLTSATDAGADSGADGGDASPWAVEWVDDDPDPFNPLQTLSVTGSGPDDVWFVGVRGSLWILGGGCSVVVRKTAAGYERIVDGTAGFFTTDCTEKPGKTRVIGALTNVIGGTFESAGKGRGTGSLWTLEAENDLIGIEATADGGASVTFAKRPGVAIRGAWADSANDAWLLVDRTGVGGVMRGTNIWSDAGTYDVSTLVRDGVPNITALWRLRGTANTLWAVGTGNAYRKKTP